MQNTLGHWNARLKIGLHYPDIDLPINQSISSYPITEQNLFRKPDKINQRLCTIASQSGSNPTVKILPRGLGISK